uniref:Uncharacterized protein n=1 Tax=Timema monikensis TaxID=170555 RepID=A0A7R9HPG1_9NEOP|nr:unnamed protein product [Timema monikensis]
MRAKCGAKQQHTRPHETFRSHDRLTDKHTARNTCSLRTPKCEACVASRTKRATSHYPYGALRVKENELISSVINTSSCAFSEVQLETMSSAGIEIRINTARTSEKLLSLTASKSSNLIPERITREDLRPREYHRSLSIEGWEPEFYSDVAYLPVDMPTELKEHIEYIQRRKPLQMQTVWLSCEGETVDDAENIGPLFYIPMRGFPGYSFNSETPKGYLNPLAAVNFEKPKYYIHET